GTAFLFTIGKYVLAWYLGRASTTSAYGAAGSVIVILMWVYYASVILLFGAEFAQIYARETGRPVKTNKYAVPVTKEKRAEEGMSGDKEKTVKKPARKPAIAPAFAESHSRVLPVNPDPLSTTALEPGIGTGSKGIRQPWQLVGVLVLAGVAGGLLLRYKSLRKALGLYLKLQRA
ncbi:MAG TPA: YhjD/YihY/BrkB family envelope integrity protein, partial [Candidatus Dormibacteraeota bacterium]|nr:YhjD/YihY/BrkB family envelope integrity protein [Candidatus Dormibacteraeota bacterium]